VSRLSSQCGILNILQPYRPPRPDTGIALLYLYFQHAEDALTTDTLRLVLCNTIRVHPYARNVTANNFCHVCFSCNIQTNIWFPCVDAAHGILAAKTTAERLMEAVLTYRLLRTINV
jgi:hypothetical protein